MLSRDEMTEPVVTVTWCAADLQSVNPTMSDEDCVEKLSDLASAVEASCIAAGWETIESSLNWDDFEEDEEEEMP